MKSTTGFTAIAALLLVFAPAVCAAQQHCGNPSGQRAQIERARQQFDHSGVAQDQTTVRLQLQVADEEIYGHEVMTKKELRKYRKKLRRIGSDDRKLERFLAAHREKMVKRAKDRGIELEEAQG